MLKRAGFARILAPTSFGQSRSYYYLAQLDLSCRTPHGMWLDLLRAAVSRSSTADPGLDIVSREPTRRTLLDGKKIDPHIGITYNITKLKFPHRTRTQIPLQASSNVSGVIIQNDPVTISCPSTTFLSPQVPYSATAGRCTCLRDGYRYKCSSL